MSKYELIQPLWEAAETIRMVSFALSNEVREDDEETALALEGIAAAWEMERAASEREVALLARDIYETHLQDYEHIRPFDDAGDKHAWIDIARRLYNRGYRKVDEND